MNKRPVEENIVVRDFRAVKTKVFEAVEPFSGVVMIFLSFAQAYFALSMSSALSKVFGGGFEVCLVIITGLIIALARASK